MLGMYIIPKIIGAIGPDRLYQDGYCDASSYAIYSGLSLTWPFSQAGQTTKC